MKEEAKAKLELIERNAKTPTGTAYQEKRQYAQHLC